MVIHGRPPSIISNGSTDRISAPYHRKSAYDLGEGGAGSTANDLQLGCDCLGSIRYFDRWINDVEGKPVKMKNCLCMHEVDAVGL